ncbi:hypothetical protein O181_016629 [Austropuccinia psidii MF-1]|uniref:Protein PNS1 n=1 Tax=Austropuccinia psidii MF-1 TaxID=1389203 RepID=A0A9Q3C494_9BASI|nr:hypothetical protein [Austropuccinia psidii MF-1]
MFNPIFTSSSQAAPINPTNSTNSTPPNRHHHKLESASQSFFGSQFINNQTGPSFSRFLSTSIINPIYKSKLFPSSTSSENPLFYSTRDGYELGLHDDDDILPKEDDVRLQNGLIAGHHGRGIDDSIDDQSDSSRFLSNLNTQNPTSSNSKQKSKSIQSNQSINQTHLDNQNQTLLNFDQTDQDDDPFYEHPHPILANQANPNRNFHNPGLSHQLPRHLLASNALSNMMASEIAYGNSHLLQTQPSQSIHPSSSNHKFHPQSNLVNTPNDHPPKHQTGHDGWKLYQSLAPDHFQAHPHLVNPSTPPIEARQSSSIKRNQSSQRLADSTILVAPKASDSRPFQKQSLDQSLPSSSNVPKAHPINQNQFTNSSTPAPVLYIYPTEARDIGSEVSGQPSIGPQTYRDAFWMAAWLASILYTSLQSIWVLLISQRPNARQDDQNERIQKSDLMGSLPILALLITITFGFCLLSLCFLVMVKRSIKLLVYGTIIGVPSVLGMIGLWTWSVSISDQSQKGMGYLSLLTIVISLLYIKLMWGERQRIDRTIKVLDLSTGVVIEHPSLVLVCLGMSMMCILLCIPFITLVYQFVLNGHYDHNQWIINSGSLTQVLVTGFVWSWSLNVIRNLQRIIIAGVVSHWYFNRHSPLAAHQAGYSSVETTYQSMARAFGPSLGTVCLSACLLTCFDTISKFLKAMKHFSSRSNQSNNQQSGFLSFLLFSNPISRFIWSWIGPLIGFGTRIFEFMNNYAIVYSGITGFHYWESCKRVTGLISQNGQINLVNSLLVKMILNFISLTMSLTFSLIGYKLYFESQRSTIIDDSNKAQKPTEIGFELPLVVIICGLLPFWLIRFVTDLISNSVDTLFLCWNIDLDIGTNHSIKTQKAFIGQK